LNSMSDTDESNNLPVMNAIFGVLYSPFGTFKKIRRGPNLYGPLVILALNLVFISGAQLITASKILTENYMPIE